MKRKIFALVISLSLFFTVILSVPVKSIDVGTTPQGYTVDSYDGAAQTTADANTLQGNITAIHSEDANGVDEIDISDNIGALDNHDSYSIDGWSWDAEVNWAKTYISVPTGYASKITTASDVVASIDTDGTLDMSHISEIRDYNNSVQDHDNRYYYEEFPADGWTGTDFPINLHEGVAIFLESSFIWNINGTDSSDSVLLTRDTNATGYNYISVPYTLKDQNGDKNLTARDLHISMDDDASLDTSHISEVRNYDQETRGFTMRYHKGVDGWTGDFPIEPGDSISIIVQNNFTWDPELITEPVPSGSSPGVDGLWVERDRTAGDVILHWNDIGASGGYNIYHSTDPYASWPWTAVDTGFSGTTYTHTGVLSDGNSDYYIVRGADGTTETENSSIAFCVEKDLNYVGSGYSGNEKWRDIPDNSSNLGEEVFFIGEQESGDGNYTWCTNTSLSEDHNIPPKQEYNTARWEKIPSYNDGPSVGTDWVNLTFEHPKYTVSYDKNDKIGGTFENFDSYALFIKGGSYASYTYLGNTKLLGSYETDPGSYDAPLTPFDWTTDTPDNTDPSTISTGLEFFNITGIDTDQTYSIILRENYDIGTNGGYGGGMGTDVYTTYSGSYSLLDFAIIPINEFPQIIVPVMITMGVVLLATYHRREKETE